MTPHASLTPGQGVLRLSIIALAVLGPAAALAWAAGWIGPRHLSPSSIVDVQEQGGLYPGFRRAHAKGICVAGTFTATGALAPLSSAQVLRSGTVPVAGRLSIGGGNPTAPDAAAGVRSMALQLQLPDGQQWRMAMNTPPVLAVGTPENFLRQLEAMAPDPATGKPNPARMAAFFASHPESAAFRAWQAAYQPTSSFASTRFHSINAFVLVSPTGARQPVRWAMVPQSDASPLIKGEYPPDYLQRELRDRLDRGPIRWAMEFTLAEPDDDAADPTRAWPDDRRRVVGGVVEITSSTPQQGGACNGINFDPTVLPRGVEPSQDPILAARSAAYAESLRRRAREQQEVL